MQHESEGSVKFPDPFLSRREIEENLSYPEIMPSEQTPHMGQSGGITLFMNQVNTIPISQCP